MKRFVYLDTDYTNSYLAQSDGGLVDSFSHTDHNITEQSKTSETIENTGSIGTETSFLGLIKLHANTGEDSSSNSINKGFTKGMEDMINKSLHDHSFNLLYSKIKSEHEILTSKEYSDNGNFVELNGNMHMYDLKKFLSFWGDRFEKANSHRDDNDAISAKIEEKFGGYNLKKIKSKEVIKDILDNREEVEETIKKSNIANIKSRELINDYVIYMLELLPSSKYILFEDYFIPIPETYLRDDYNMIKYKYNGPSTIFGYVNTTIGEIINYESAFSDSFMVDIFKTLPDLFTEMFKLMGKITFKTKVLYPIAWYF